GPGAAAAAAAGDARPGAAAAGAGRPARAAAGAAPAAGGGRAGRDPRTGPAGQAGRGAGVVRRGRGGAGAARVGGAGAAGARVGAWSAGAGVELAEPALTLLVDRTEGWVAGLRLAALSLAGHPDPDRFAAEFSGSDRTVAEYLLAEVLDRQPEPVRRLLLRTSVLERGNGELAGLLTGASGGAGEGGGHAGGGHLVVWA